MKLFSITQTMNEQDIIEPFVRHHMKLLDEMWICDESADETWTILQKLANEFDGRLHLSRQSDFFGKSQRERTAALLQEAELYTPDYIFPLDADEFISAGKRETVEESVSGIPAGYVGAMRWKTYVLTNMLSECDDPPASFHHRRAAEMPPYSKVVLNAHNHSGKMVLMVGNHSVLDMGMVIELNRLPLLHFPVRSVDQYLTKVVTCWEPLVDDPDLKQQGQATHRKALYEKYKDKTTADAIGESQSFAQQGKPETVMDIPTVFDYVRLYSDGKPMNYEALRAKVLADPLCR